MTAKGKNKESAEKLLSFIAESPSCYHVVANIEKVLAKKGFRQLKETDTWSLEPGEKYYVNRNGSSLIAFTIPKDTFHGFHITASHSDSPALKIKENPEIVTEGHYVSLNVEKYGGMIMSSWLDRPLSVAGAVVFEKENNVETRLVNFDRNLCVIPSQAIHMNREVNKGVALNPQVDMQPLFMEGSDKHGFMRLLAEELSIEKEKILGMDLLLYPRQQGEFLGKSEEFICSPRLDNLQGVFTSLEGFLEAENEKRVMVYSVFHNEEVGSRTRQGAASDFLRIVLEEICNAAFGKSQHELRRLMANSFLVSVDNAHALHPNHKEKSDITNKVFMNNGIVIKYQGAQKYATDAVTGAIFKKICKDANVPYQTYENRSDISGGSTLGNIIAEQVPIPAVDIGLAQLAMHAACETAGTKDTVYMIKAIKAFYEMCEDK